MKKFTAIILALLLMFSLSITAFAATGNSEVSIAVDTANISVTLPLNITITAKVDGGDADVPENYQIVNSSAIPIKVDSVAVTLNDATDWAFSAAPITAGTAQVGGVNAIYLSVNGVVLAADTTGRPGNAGSALLPWNISAGETKNLPLVCSTSMLDQTTTEDNLITIAYIVSAGSYMVDD